MLLEQHRTATTHEERRPPECELSATRFALAMIEKYDLQGKLCHYSVGEGLPLDPRSARRGVQVTAEVTPHHVFFDTAQITDRNRPWMQMNPPLRSPADRAAMLEALRDGDADYLATDHAPHTIAEKERGISGQPHLDTYGAFRDVAAGRAGIYAGAHRGYLLRQPRSVRQCVSAERSLAGCCPVTSAR